MVQPSDIDLGMWDTFGHRETEMTALWIVKLCQSKGSWSPLSRSEVEQFYAKEGPNDGFWWNGLDEPQWMKGSGDDFELTEDFILCVSKPGYYKILPTSVVGRR